MVSVIEPLELLDKLEEYNLTDVDHCSTGSNYTKISNNQFSNFQKNLSEKLSIGNYKLHPKDYAQNTPIYPKNLS